MEIAEVSKCRIDVNRPHNKYNSFTKPDLKLTFFIAHNPVNNLSIIKV